MNSIIVIVSAVTIFVTVLLAVVVVGIKLEPSASELSTKAPNLTAAIVRHALGVSVRKPNFGEPARETCLIGQRPSNWPKGRDQ